MEVAYVETRGCNSIDHFFRYLGCEWRRFVWRKRSLCSNCELRENHKFVSICSSKNLVGKNGFLQYRYGEPKKVELAFYKELMNSLAQFDCDEYSRPDLSTFMVGFNNGGYRYEISEATEGVNDDGITTKTLLVSSGVDKRSIKLTCLDNKKSVSNISALGRILKCDKIRGIAVDGCE